MHRLPLSRNPSQPIPANEPDVQEGLAFSIKTCFLAIVLIIAPALGLAAAALSDVVFPYVEAPSVKAPRLSPGESQDALRSPDSRIPISEAAPRSQE